MPHERRRRRKKYTASPDVFRHHEQVIQREDERMPQEILDMLYIDHPRYKRRRTKIRRSR